MHPASEDPLQANPRPTQGLAEGPCNEIHPRTEPGKDVVVLGEAVRAEVTDLIDHDSDGFEFRIGFPQAPHVTGESNRRLRREAVTQAARLITSCALALELESRQEWTVFTEEPGLRNDDVRAIASTDHAVRADLRNADLRKRRVPDVEAADQAIFVFFEFPTHQRTPREGAAFVANDP